MTHRRRRFWLYLAIGLILLGLILAFSKPLFGLPLRSPKDSEKRVPMKRQIIRHVTRPRFARVVPPKTTPVSLSWSSVPASGFKVYYGPGPFQFTNAVDTGNVTNYTLQVPRGIVYLAVTSYNAAGRETDFSNEVTNGLPYKPNVVVLVWTNGGALIWIATNPTAPWQFWTGHNMRVTSTNF